ncbi:MAG: hypothetical protein KDE14_12355 [Rhodobacteraceae bacterium]|nr:hypothetical protein [Paracoccaceae bacterium]
MRYVFGSFTAPRYERCFARLIFWAGLFVVLLPMLTSAATLKVASPASPSSYANIYNSLPTAIAQTPGAILDPLLRLGPNNSLEPVLAESWQSDGLNQWTFKLRKDVVFSNGEPFDSFAVKSAIEFLQSPAGATQVLATEVRGITRILTPDASTVVFVTDQPDAILPKRLSIIFMVPPRAFAEMGLEKFNQAPIGTGPYVLKAWGLSSGKTTIEANPLAWSPPRQIDRVEIYPLKDPITRVQALTAGQVDIAFAVNYDDIPYLRQQGFVVTAKQESQILALAFRTTGTEPSPLKDVRVRQALNYAVDKKAIAEAIYFDFAQPTGQGAIAGTTGYNPEIAPYPYDPARARVLLAEAGYPGGFFLNGQIVTGQYVGDASVYQKVASDFAQIGVTLELNTTTQQEWIKSYATGDWGAAQAIGITWQSAVYGDLMRAIQPFSCRKYGAFFCAPEIEPMIDESQSIFDPMVRERKLQDIMARLHDLAPTLFLVNISTVIAASDAVHDIVATRSGFRFERMTVSPP